MDEENVIVPVNLNYDLTLKGKTRPDYTIAQTISLWLQENLQKLQDNTGKKVFNKVNMGFNENTLRNFGNQPVCDVYIGGIDYDSTYEVNKPCKAHSFILFYFKGANDKAYLNVCAIHDYIMQEFSSNENYQVLPGLVRDTLIDGSKLMSQPIQKKWGVMGALELSHILF